VKLAVSLWLLAFSVTTYADWTKAVVDSGPYKPISLITGNGRNDDTVRLYWTSDDNLLREATYRNGSWQKGIIGAAGSHLVISPAHNDGINRIYTIKGDTLSEYTWSNGIWLKETHPLPDSASRFFAAPLRNDDTIRLYFDGGFCLYELTHRLYSWEVKMTDSFSSPIGDYFTVGIGRNDDSLRLYAFWPWGYSLSFTEITYSPGQWREEMWTYSLGTVFQQVKGITLGKGRSDSTNRIYVGITVEDVLIYWSAIWEMTYSFGNWGQSSNLYAAGGELPLPRPYPLLVERVRNNTTRLYAFIDGHGTDTTGLYEFTYYSTDWKRNIVDTLEVSNLTACLVKNDDTIRLYGIQKNKIIELTRIPTAVGEQTEKLKPVQPTLQIHPNPFSEKTEIRYEMASTEKTSIQIFDAAGRVIKVFSKTQSPESKTYWFGDDELGRNVPSGIYFCQLKTAGQTISIKVTLLR
jgi:hypothetical protein